MMKYFLPLLFISISFHIVKAQPCTTLGQTPATAFPVCGTTTFNQGSVGICGNTDVPTQCSGSVFKDKNPYWYKFTCFSSGTLGFVITPIEISDDYDWQLFDITGRNPNDVYTDGSLFVACNWSGDGGLTGASSAGTSLVRCEGPGVPLFSAMPTLITGHNYLLLVSHFTDSQVGYSLSFGGGTADITDPLPSHIVNAYASCDASRITVKLSKKMKCKSLSPDGSDFTLNAPGINIINASGNGCSTGFDMDSVTLTLSAPLSPGNYTLTIVKGNDSNTLLDNCDRSVPENETLPLTILPLAPTPMDSLTTPGCKPQSLQLVFNKPIRCNSIAADGSDFTVTGTYPVTVTGASGNCSNGLTTTITVQLSSPLQVAGNFNIRLRTGSDGNTLLDDCTQETPAGSSLLFIIKDTVNADFTYSILYGCERNTVQYLHNGNNGVTSWNWNFDNLRTSTLQSPIISYTSFEQKTTTLVVSNGVCTDTSTKTIYFDNFMDVKFEATSLVCPGDQVSIKNTTQGNIVTWQWDFGNGTTGNVKDPTAQTYELRTATYNARIKLIATNNFGCKDSAFQFIKVINNCFIAVPSAFTPNGDGLNDYLYPLNAYKAADLSFSVFNRFGQRVFFTRDWTNKWDGTFKGQGADPGTYVWVLSYLHTDTNKRVEQKGTTVLLR